MNHGLHSASCSTSPPTPSRHPCGVRYPACPDHSEKFKLFDLLDATAVGIALTEHAAMTPAASVSGLYVDPHARYFNIGRLGEDQIAVYAQRKGMSIE